MQNRQDLASESMARQDAAVAASAEYRRGLSDVIAAAGSQAAAKLLTSAFALGYAAGKADGSIYLWNAEDGFVVLGCAGALPLIAERDATKMGALDECNSLERPEYKNAGLPGRNHADNRLRLATSLQGVDIVNAALQAFDNAYYIGAGDAAWGVALESVRSWTIQGCRSHLERHGMFELTAQCDAIGQQAAMTYAQELTELANRRMATK